MFVIPDKAISDINTSMVYREDSSRVVELRLAGHAQGLVGVTSTMRRGIASVWVSCLSADTRHVRVTLLFNNMSFVVLRKPRRGCLVPAGALRVFPIVKTVYRQLIPRRTKSCL